MMQKAFIFLMIIWNSSTFAPGNGTDHLQFLLGCRAVIPCRHKRSNTNSFKWFYKKNEHTEKIQIFFEDKKGLQHQPAFRPRGSVTHDRSLVINYFTEDDQGLYWCEYCYEDTCSSEKSTVIRVTKEILSEIHKTVYVTAGSSFTHSCSFVHSWTFEASNMNTLGNPVVRRETDFVTSNKSLHIVNVKRTDAGKYTCWTNKCHVHRQKILTINLCVITVHQSGNSSVSCAVVCDVEFNNIRHNGMSNEKTGTRTLSVHADPYGSLNCSTKQIFHGYSTINSTHMPSNASSKTTGTNTQPEYLTPVIYGTSAAIACLILMALLSFFFRSRLWADFSDNHSGCDTDGRVEEENSVVYSSVVIRRPAKTTNTHVDYSDCVYSEIKV